MKTVTPIDTLGLIPVIDQKLLNVLRPLRPNDWSKSTISPDWCIKDVALHLLDGNIKGISTNRDSHFMSNTNYNEEHELVSFVNRQNSLWIAAGQRISNNLLIELLEMTNHLYHDHLKKLDLYADAVFPVSWAGEKRSYNWFHIAREYTEKYHHQQQIRHTMGLDEDLYAPKFYKPFLNTVMRALPYHYANIEADIATVISVEITNDLGEWFLMKGSDNWELYKECDIHPVCKITIDYNVAWRLFTKGLTNREIQKYVEVEGDWKLGEKIFAVKAIIG